MTYNQMIRYALAKGFSYMDDDTIDTLVDGVMETLKSKARTTQQLNALNNFYGNLDINKRNEFNRLTGRITGFERVIGLRREEAIGLTYENIKGTVFERSIKRGVVTKSFANFYKLNEDEAGEIVERLRNQGVEGGYIS